MQTNIVQKAGINPKTLPSGVVYWHKLQRNISTVLFLPYFVGLIIASLTPKASLSTQLSIWQVWLLGLGFGGLILGILYNLWAIYVVPRIYARQVRILAIKNNLNLLPKSKLIEFIPDSVRQSDAHHEQALGCALPVSEQQVVVFDYSCTVGSGKHKKYLVRSLAVLQLKGNYPHLFLDSKKNGKNHHYAASQKVELEGDFSKYFDVYIPEGSQAGSLTVFAPDIMQTILNTGKLFDVEINGDKAVIISDELVFTNKVLPNILNCAAGLSKEFKELDRTWQPVFAPSGKRFMLKGQPLWRVLFISIMPFIFALSLGFLLKKINIPVNDQPAVVVTSQDSSPYGLDAATLAAARQIASKLNAYTAKYPVPDTLAQAYITNPLASIGYTKLMPDIYQFCATYYGYINGNGPTGASGNIVAYYGATVDSPNLPSTLQIVEWHNEGKNCQIIKPALPATE